MVGVVEMNDKEVHAKLCNQWLERADAVTRRMESKWGVERLPKCVPPEMAQRWERHWKKLSEAVMGSRYEEATELAAGCIRGWEALEKAAVASGYSPDIGHALECPLPSGGVLRVCSSSLDASRPAPPGYTVITLAEVARLVESRALVNVIAENSKTEVVGREIPRLPNEVWFGGGESIPF